MLNAKGLLHSEIQCTSEQLPGDVFRAGCTQKQLPEMPGVAVRAAWVLLSINSSLKLQPGSIHLPGYFLLSFTENDAKEAKGDTASTLLSQV